MAYQLSYAGQTLRIPAPELMERLNRFEWLAQLRDVLPPQGVSSWPGPNLLRSGFPSPYQYPDLRIGDFFYPTGASRWSVFRGLMTATDLAAIPAFSAVLTGDPISDILFSAPFVMQSTGGDSTGSVTTGLYLLPPIPVAGTDADTPTVYLVTLVDERYIWHQGQLQPDILSGSLGSWSDLLNKLASIQNIALTFDAPDAAYGIPEADSPLFTNSFDSVAVLLDLVAANVGCVVVRDLASNVGNSNDPIYRLVRYTDSKAALIANRPTSKSNILGGPAVLPMGSQNPAFLRSILPASVRVVFPTWTDEDADGFQTDYNNPNGSQYREWYQDSYPATMYVDVTAASAGVLPTANTGFIKVLRTTAKARQDASMSPVWTNQADCTALATILAQDYYNSRLAWDNEIFAGIYSWTPEGFSDLLFTWRGDAAYTRVLPPPFNFGLTDFQHGFSPQVLPVDEHAVRVSDGTTTSQGVRTIEFNPGFTVTFNSMTAIATVTSAGASGTSQSGDTILNGRTTMLATDGATGTDQAGNTVNHGRITAIATDGESTIITFPKVSGSLTFTNGRLTGHT